MVDPKLKSELKETQKHLRDAVSSLRKAADRAGHIAKATGDEFRHSQEFQDAHTQAGDAIKAMESAAKAATRVLAAGAAGISKSDEVKKVAAKTAVVARSTVEVAKSAGKAASGAVRSSAASAGRKAAEAKEKAQKAAEKKEKDG